MKQKYGMATRHLVVRHPENKDVVLFEAEVKIININSLLVKSINGIDIRYELTQPN